jgi:predicted Zn-dependent peptidase
VEAFTRMREIVDELRTAGPSAEEVERARAYAAGRRVLAFENTNAVARHAAAQTVVFGQDIDPDAAIAALDGVTFDEVREIADGISESLSVACVGPHSLDDFS